MWYLTVIGFWEIDLPRLGFDADSNVLHASVKNKDGDILFYRLNNVTAIKGRARKERKLQNNRKLSLTYQVEEYEKWKNVPMAFCDFCHSLELPHVPRFVTCQKCQTPCFCSRECARADWRANGGRHKPTCTCSK